MREINIRAWDFDRRQYLSGGAVFIEVLYGRQPSNGSIYLDTLAWKFPDRFDLQQYTLLTYMNGEEIYEGDI